MNSPSSDPPRTNANTLPLVYACSGCSSAAQLANHLAVRLDREHRAEMSCIAGIGADIPSLVRVAMDAVTVGRPVLAIDGCPLSCVKRALERHSVVPTHHLALWQQGVRKRQHEDFDPEQAWVLLERCRDLVEALRLDGPACRVPATPPDDARDALSES